MTETDGSSPGSVMRADWNRRAEEDHKLHIATGHARSEEEFRASGEKDLVEEILDGITLSPDAEALEIGCGVGRLLAPLSERIAAAHGVDISEVMVGKSKEYCAGRPNVTTRVTDGTLEAFADGSVDFVYSFIVFQHVPLREAIATYVRDAARILVPGGLLRFQVDGRWRERAGRTADTYDGVVFSPAEARALVEGAGLSCLEEWGEETHYHWVTAEKPGSGPGRARFHPGSCDTALLGDLLAGLGVPEPAEKARDVSAGRIGIRAALGAFEDALAALPNARFVEEVLRGLLGHASEPSGLAYHTRILDEGFEDRAAMVDTVLSGAEFRQLVRPRVPRVPWSRLAPLAGRDGVPGFFDAVDAAVERIRDLPPVEAVDESFRLLVGHPPDAEGRAYNVALLGRSAFSVRLFVRQLLSAGDGLQVPAPLPGSRADDLLDRLGARGVPPSPHAIEAFPGEAVAAVRFLGKTSSLGSADFVAIGYSAIFGRPADEEGRDYYSRRLDAGTLSRASFLRELLWSDELRAP
jgi:SAM-dependent methyltransferase